MLKIFLDTNILLDYFGIGCTPENQSAAVSLVKALWEKDQGFLMTPACLKDFQYLLGVQLKKAIKVEKGQVDPADAAAVAQVVRGALEHLMEVGTVASESMADCEMARALLSAHSDYEDNIIAAVALRSQAHCIVSRDKRFAAHCPVACLSPEEALVGIRAGAWV